MTDDLDVAEQPQHTPLEDFDRKLEQARKELLETSTRSRLLHTPLGSSHAKIIEVKDELSDQVFSILVREGRSMSFQASARILDEADNATVELPQPDDENPNDGGIARRHLDNKLQTGLPSERLQTRLRSIAYDAQTVESEQGVNILYLALGFLKWYQAREENKPRYAPLILIPVTLSRATVNERFKIAYSGEELATNLSLQHRLKEEGIALPDLPEVDDLQPQLYFSSVAKSIGGMPNWSVQSDAIVLGFFSFAKLMMYRDLEPDRWPASGSLRNHAILTRLLGEGFRDEMEPLIPDDVSVDTVVDIAAAGHVVDADSSQTLAIDDVSKGQDLVIQGPPGTGKSQTITNLISSAVRGGKRVLFVAEKMAALNVVRANLDRLGLGQICLELHSHKAKKKSVLQDLEETYQRSTGVGRSEEGLATRLRDSRDKLNAHVLSMHSPLDPSELTPFEVFGKLAKLAGKGSPPPNFQLLAAKKWSHRDIEQHQQRVEQLAAHVGRMGVPAKHPWRGVGLDVVLPQDAQRFSARALILRNDLSELIRSSTEIAARVRVTTATFSEVTRFVLLGELLARAPAIDASSIANEVWNEDRARITELLNHGSIDAKVRRSLGDILTAEAWEQDFTAIEQQFNTYGHSWLRWLRSEYRSAVRQFREFYIGPIPTLLRKRVEVLRELSVGQHERRAIHALDNLGASAFGTKWLGDESDWPLLHAIDDWELYARSLDLPPRWREGLGDLGDLSAFAKEVAGLGRKFRELKAKIDSLFVDLSLDIVEAFGTIEFDSLDFSRMVSKFSAYADGEDRLPQWCTWRLWSREARQVDLGEVVDRLADGRLEADQAGALFQYACYEALARQIFTVHSNLAVFDGRLHEQILNEFAKLDRERMDFARKEVGARHVEMMPRGGARIGEVGILSREWRKQRRHLPLRQLIKASGRAMQLIKPVWMMSPMSLAQFVEPGALDFDLVLMDEASQVRPVEALGAIARGKQIVVVGDEKQLPPTSFFDRLASEDSPPTEGDEFQTADVESILGLCSAQGIPDRMLRWHYRSQHESLIAVSNLEFYKRLFIVPSAESADLGLRFRRVKGVYDRGRTATNRLEAQELANAVLEHARCYGRSARYPTGMSLAVGTFSVAQRDAILEELELLWRQHPEVAEFFDPNAPEPFFVKNLESIQGDERDVIFISIGYGPDENGYVAMGFGPLSAQGGERRLNVLISRARRRCEVFSSITAADIDLSRTQSVGVRVLKTFLQYAETGKLDRSEVHQRDADSDFEEDVGVTLAGLGYPVEHQVGVAGFYIDLAIKDRNQPGRYLLGIECDGATYHSARSARDRDRLREQVLRDRGWEIHRIWSTDWFKRRNEELQRVIRAISAAESASRSPRTEFAQSESSTPPDIRHAVHEPSDTLTEVTDSPPRPSYVEADFEEHSVSELHELRLSKRVEIISQIVAIEGPIHEEEICRRFATICGKDRTGARIQNSVVEALKSALRERKVHADGGFYSLGPVVEKPPRDRSGVRSPTLKRPDMLPPVEIRTGLRQVVADHIGVEPRAAVVEVARMFGFQRTGLELERTIEEHLRMMLGEGVFALRNGNRLYIAKREFGNAVRSN